MTLFIVARGRTLCCLRLVRFSQTRMHGKEKLTSSAVVALLPLAHDCFTVPRPLYLVPLSAGFLLDDDANNASSSGSRFRFLGAGTVTPAVEDDVLALIACASAAARARVRIGALKMGGCIEIEYPLATVEVLTAGEMVAGGGGVSSITMTSRSLPLSSTSWTSL